MGSSRHNSKKMLAKQLFCDVLTEKRKCSCT
nr:MAG TPA: hypothetical protein [Caudoviricetes sp.]